MARLNTLPPYLLTFGGGGDCRDVPVARLFFIETVANLEITTYLCLWTKKERRKYGSDKHERI